MARYKSMLSYLALVVISSLSSLTLASPAENGIGQCDPAVPPPLIYTLRSGVHYHYNGTSRRLMPTVGQGANVGLDYWYKERMIVWSNVGDERLYICRAPERLVLGDAMASCTAPNGNLTVVREQVADPDGLAIDWVHGLLFRTDAAHNKMFVMDLRSMRERVLIDSGLDDPRAVAVDPPTGVIFWTDWGSGRVERAGMDGGDRTALPTTYGDYRIQWPNGLALDISKRRVYWVEAKSSKGIYSTDYWGEGFRTDLLSSDIQHPFSIAVTAEWFIWTDWDKQGIVASRRCSNETNVLVTSGKIPPMTVRVFDPATQPQMEDSCGGHKCLPDELCLPKSQLERYMSYETLHVGDAKDERSHIRPYSCMNENGTRVDRKEAPEVAVAEHSSKEGSRCSGLLLVAVSVAFFLVGGVVASAVTAYCLLRTPEWIRRLGSNNGLLSGDGAASSVAYAGFDNIVLTLGECSNQRQ